MVITADAIGGPGSGKIRRLERRLSYVSAKLASPDVAMSDGVRNHMNDEKGALEWALPILRRHVCYEVDGGLVGDADRRYLDTLDEKADRLESLARELRRKSMNQILRTTDTKGGSPI